jgi:E2F-associated phosphoprotein
MNNATNDPVISCDDIEEDEDEDDLSVVGEDTKNDGADKEEEEQDLLYDQDADEEDEAYVYRSMRQGGRTNSTNNSDAILQCPCCFQTVCFDCQQHTVYKHIFRAMFVTGITVAWDRPLRYNPTSHSLEEEETTAAHHSQTQQHPRSDHIMRISHSVDVDDDTEDDDDDDNDDKVYYTVRCGSCETVVAALDMRKEIYHFSHCLASTASSLPANSTAMEEEDSRVVEAL